MQIIENARNKYYIIKHLILRIKQKLVNKPIKKLTKFKRKNIQL